MLNLIKKRILDFREDGIPEFRKRDFKVTFIKDMVTAIVGVRKAGKTYLTYQVISEELEAGRIDDIGQVCYLHFDDEALLGFTVNEMDKIEQSLLEINANFFDKTCLFVFDEIHKISNWESYVLRLLRKKNTRILVTGSSSELEEDKVDRQLRGKAFHLEVFPLSFKEYVDWHGFEYNIHALSTKDTIHLKKLFEQFLREGGFPGIFELASTRDKNNLLQTYYRSIITSDFIEAIDGANVVAVKAFLNRLMQGNASHYFHTKTFNSLKSMGVSVTKALVSAWYHQAEACYFLKSNAVYALSENKIAQNPRIPYVVDWAMANSIGNPLELKRTRSLETIIFYDLLRMGVEVSYYRSTERNQAEIDFIAYHHFEDPELAIQVSFDVSNPATLEREIRSLMGLKGNKSNSIRRVLITMTPQSEVELPSSIQAINPIEWLLGAVEK